MSMNVHNKKSRYDVIVTGGGPAGIAAAVAASRQGFKTLIIESTGCFGGTSTSAALPLWLGMFSGSIPFRKMLEKGLRYRDLPRPMQVVGGIYSEIVNGIKAANGGVGPAALAHTDKYPGLDRLGCHDDFFFDIEIGKRVLDEFVTQAGCDILFHTIAVATEVDGRRVKGVYTANKDGLSFYEAKTVIDCSGDADMVAHSGFDTYKGDQETGEMTAISVVVHIENIDSSEIETYLNDEGDPWFLDICQKAQQDRPDAGIPGRLILFPMLQDGVFMINGGTFFYGMDGTNPDDITRLMLMGRQRGRVLVEELFRPYVPGAKHCRLRLSAAYPGVRETRRIVAEYTLTEDDLLNGHRFEDTVALAGRHFDLSRGNKGAQPFQKQNRSVKGGVAPIPYRCMIPKDTENIIVAGRCVAADGQAMGPARIMSTCFAMGQAAGTAAGLHLKHDIAYRDINTTELRDNLRNQNAIIDY